MADHEHPNEKDRDAWPGRDDGRAPEARHGRRRGPDLRRARRAAYFIASRSALSGVLVERRLDDLAVVTGAAPGSWRRRCASLITRNSADLPGGSCSLTSFTKSPSTPLPSRRADARSGSGTQGDPGDREDDEQQGRRAAPQRRRRSRSCCWLLVLHLELAVRVVGDDRGVLEVDLAGLLEAAQAMRSAARALVLGVEGNGDGPGSSGPPDVRFRATMPQGYDGGPMSDRDAVADAPNTQPLSRNHDFRLLAVSQDSSIGAHGRRDRVITDPEFTGSGLRTGRRLAIQPITDFGVSTFAGAVVDRGDRKRIAGRR